MVKDMIPYIANIAVVARADGTLTANELGQLEAIRQELGAKKGEFNAALKLAESGNHKLVPIGTFADQVKNLEFILRTAYADTDLSVEEMELLAQFRATIGIQPDQYERMSGEVLEALHQELKLCPACHAENAVDSRFCAKCGMSLVAEPKQDTQISFTIPDVGIAIEFAESTAATFPKALEIAKQAGAFQSCLKGKKSWYLAAFPSGDLKDAMPLVESLSGIRNRNVYMSGREVQWDELFGFVWCASLREKAYRPNEYCFGKDENRLNPWGCKQARLEWTEWANWFCYGEWEKKGLLNQKLIWRLDKERIKHELSTNLHRIRYCPHLISTLPDAVLKHMPDTISPSNDANWDFHQSFQEVPGAVKIIQKEGHGDFSFSNEFWADGVRPKGLRVLSEILERAFQDVGLEPSQIASLIR